MPLFDKGHQEILTETFLEEKSPEISQESCFQKSNQEIAANRFLHVI